MDGIDITEIDVNAVTRERMATLSFSQTDTSVTGSYTCLADNGITEPGEATVLLTVHGKDYGVTYHHPTSCGSDRLKPHIHFREVVI